MIILQIHQLKHHQQLNQKPNQGLKITILLQVLITNQLY